MSALFRKTKELQTGIYFSHNSINLVQSQGNKVVKTICSPLNKEQINPMYLFIDETKTAVAIQEVLDKNKIESGKISIALSARDLIMRYFELPIMPTNELNSAIMFESKRYLPFKLEDVYFDFQYALDKKEKKIKILFVGIKKEIIDQYYAVFKKLNFTINFIEPAHFGLLKIIRLEKVASPYAVIDIGLKSANITVISDNFIHFSRDLNMPAMDNIPQDELVQSANLLVKFINEVRISLDYYRRQPSSSSIKKIALLYESGFDSWPESLSKELGIATDGIMVSTIKTYPQAKDLDIARALSVSLVNIKSTSSINLGKRRGFVTSKKSKKESLTSGLIAKLQYGILAQENVRNAIIFSIIFIVVVYGYAFQKRLPFLNKLNGLNKEIKYLQINWPYTTNEDLEKIQDKYQSKFKVIEKTMSRRYSITPWVNSIPKLLSNGLWVSKIDIGRSKGSVTLNISGKVYLKNESKEIQAIDEFVTNLKKSADFNNVFQEIEMGRLNSTEKIKDIRVTSFEVKCK